MKDIRRRLNSTESQLLEKRTDLKSQKKPSMQKSSNNASAMNRYMGKHCMPYTITSITAQTGNGYTCWTVRSFHTSDNERKSHSILNDFLVAFA